MNGMAHLRWRLHRPTTPPSGVRTAAALVLVFTLLALATRLACLGKASSTVFWPANGALVVALLVLPGRLSAMVLAACALLNFGINLFTAYSLFDDVEYSLLNVGVSVLVAFLTRNFCGARIDLSRFRRLAAFGTIAFVSVGLEAMIGEAIDPGGTTKAEVFNDWMQWTLCDGFGFLIATPALLLPVAGAPRAFPCAAGRVERWSLLVGTAVLTALAFSLSHAPFFMLIYPLLVLTAFRAGPPWVLGSILSTSMISAGLTAHGFGPLALLSSRRLLLGQGMVQPFLMSIFLCAAPANNALGEKGRAARRLLQMKAAMEHAATHDTLTTLVNRDVFRRHLVAMLRGGLDCAVLFVDLDRFKQVNDTMGHAAGDQLLRAFSVRVLAAISARCSVARAGGDEFAILVPGGAGDPEEVCRTVIEIARTPFLLATGPAHVSASIGVALAPGSSDPGEIMRRADLALYAAKTAGRDGYRIYSEDLERSWRDRAQLKGELERAIGDGTGLRLAYQVKVSGSGIVQGVEALLRWHHPVRGVVPVTDVISVAEESGLIVPLGAWILGEALAFARRWPALDVAINVSPLQLRHPRFVEDTLGAVRGSGVAAERIELEVTETALMDDVDSVGGKLATLRAAGLRIALDDFGTGFSSLRHLHRCAVDRVKIDRSFVGALGDSEEAAAIVRAVIQLGHAVGLQVTAEGVETENQHQFLRHAEADELQGYLFGRPVDEFALAAALDGDRLPLRTVPTGHEASGDALFGLAPPAPLLAEAEA